MHRVFLPLLQVTTAVVVASGMEEIIVGISSSSLEVLGSSPVVEAHEEELPILLRIREEVGLG